MRSWIAGYLILCLALAGAVGLSPFLHQLIEHGGHGEWHTHSHDVGSKHYTFDSAAALAQVDSLSQVEKKAKPVFTRNHRPFKLPTAPIVKLVGAMADLLGSPEKNSNPSAEGHEHHSLAQLLASGLLDQHVDIPVIPHFVPKGSYQILSPDELLLASIWNAQTPDRGPPACVS
ncbi:MAG TPA: hypothetical protein VGH19_23540 [Verrucomicrobiae bacterium]